MSSVRLGRITLIPIPSRSGQTVWHYRFRVAGQRTQRSTKETRLGRASAIAEEAYEAAKLRARGEEPEPTIERAIELWTQVHLLAKSPSHVANIERFGRLHLGPLKGLKLTEITTQAVEEARSLFRETHAMSSANQWLTYLRIICKWAIRRRMIRAMPFDVPELKPRRRPKALLPQAKTEEWLEQVEALTEHEPAIAMIIDLLVGMGLRVTEALRARWEWLDLEQGTYTPGETKGGEAVARPVPPWFLEEIRPMAQPYGWMIPTAKGNPVTYGRVVRVINAACEAVSIPRITPHRLRGTYATWLVREGVPLQEVQATLGHAKLETTLGYVEKDMRTVSQAQLRLAAKMGKGGRESGERIAGARIA